MMATQPERDAEWGADSFGALNQIPAEAVAGLIESLDFARTETGFQQARRAMLRDLGLAPGSSVIEGGCGTGAALPDVLELVGKTGQVLGVDPTVAFVDAARRRAAELGATNVRYEVGDIRALPAETGSVDAAFCDKVLIHAGPGTIAVRELARAVRTGGRVGAVEWFYSPLISTTHPDLVNRLYAATVQTAYDYAASANLAHYFHAAGLVDVQRRAFLGHTDSLDAHPFWRSLLQGIVPGAVGTGLLSEAEGRILLADWEELSRRGEFSMSSIIQTAVGTRPT